MSDPIHPLQLAPEPPAPPADLRFGPARGNAMSPEWMAYAVGLWHQAGDKRLTFADAMRQTVVHFMVEGEQ